MNSLKPILGAECREWENLGESVCGTLPSQSSPFYPLIVGWMPQPRVEIVSVPVARTWDRPKVASTP